MAVETTTSRNVAQARMGTDFERDLRRLNDELELLAGRLNDESRPWHDASRYVSLRYERAMLCGSWVELAELEEVLGPLLERIGPQPDLYLLKSMLDLALHRLPVVRGDIAMVPAVANSWHGQVLLADVDVQEGRYAAARRTYERILAEARTWANLARMADLHTLMGDRWSADRLYADAIDEITAKEPRAFAWVEVARGQLDLAHGDYDRAREHYERAQAAYSGYWLIDEHLAELLGAEARFESAVALYKDVVTRVSRPELFQALGDLYECMGRSTKAQIWHRRALAGYLKSTRRGGVEYLHHLVDIYADVFSDGPRAVKWAQRDFKLRPNASTEAALAWAMYRNGQLVDALGHIQHAMASGLRSAHVLRRSSMIHRAAGNCVIAEQHDQLAVRINPRLGDFHVHR